MKNTQDKTYTKEQHSLIAEFSATYGLQPEQIRFFKADPQPFFDRDATAVLIHKLTDAVGVEDEIVATPFVGSLAVKYKITFEDGSFASATGVANLEEKLDGEPMTPEQVQSLATSRAARYALRNKGIDLVKLHYANKNANVVEYSGPSQKNHRNTLISQAHVLGQECGLIAGTGEERDVTLWRRMILARYKVTNSNELSDELLADFVAFLRTLVPQTGQMAA